MKTIQMFIDSHSKNRIKAAAAALDLSVSQLLRRLISKKSNFNSISFTKNDYGTLSERFVFTITDEQKEKLEKDASTINAKISDIIRYLILEFLKSK